MSIKRGCFEYKNERDEDLLRVYRSALLTPYNGRKELVQIIANSPASRFWVSELNAEFIIRRLLNGYNIKPFAKSKLRQKMYYEIFHRVKDYLRINKNLSISQAVIMVVNSPAPSFYLTPGSISVLLHVILKKKRNERRGNYKYR